VGTVGRVSQRGGAQCGRIFGKQTSCPSHDERDRKYGQAEAERQQSDTDGRAGQILERGPPDCAHVDEDEDLRKLPRKVAAVYGHRPIRVSPNR